MWNSNERRFAYELIKRSVDDPDLYKEVYAMEKRVEVARQQVYRIFLFNLTIS